MHVCDDMCSILPQRCLILSFLWHIRNKQKPLHLYSLKTWIQMMLAQCDSPRIWVMWIRSACNVRIQCDHIVKGVTGLENHRPRLATKAAAFAIPVRFDVNYNLKPWPSREHLCEPASIPADTRISHFRERPGTMAWITKHRAGCMAFERFESILIFSGLRKMGGADVQMMMMITTEHRRSLNSRWTVCVFVRPEDQRPICLMCVCLVCMCLSSPAI